MAVPSLGTELLWVVFRCFRSQRRPSPRRSTRSISSSSRCRRSSRWPCPRRGGLRHPVSPHARRGDRGPHRGVAATRAGVVGHPRPDRDGHVHLGREPITRCGGRPPRPCRSTRSASSGCGSSSTPADSARSTNCTSRWDGRSRCSSRPRTSSTTLLPGIPHQDRRHPRPLLAAVVHGHHARPVSHLLRRVLRHEAFRHDRRGVVMEPAQYQTWLTGGAAEGTLAERGERLFQDLACTNCHLDGGQGRGPSLKDSSASPSLSDGSTVMVDEGYLRESILNSQAKVVKGFTPLMPTFQGLVTEEGSPPSSSTSSRCRHRRPRPRRRSCRCGADPSTPAARRRARESKPWIRPLPSAQLLIERSRPEVVAADQGPQAHRAALPDLDHVLLLPRRPVRRGDSPRADDAAGRSVRARDLQQALHDARRDHGLLLPDPVDPGGARQLPGPAHDRRARIWRSRASTC